MSYVLSACVHTFVLMFLVTNNAELMETNNGVVHSCLGNVPLNLNIQ